MAKKLLDCVRKAIIVGTMGLCMQGCPWPEPEPTKPTAVPTAQLTAQPTSIITPDPTYVPTPTPEVTPIPTSEPTPEILPGYPGPKTKIAFSEYNPQEEYWNSSEDFGTGIDLWFINSDGTGLTKIFDNIGEYISNGRIRTSPNGEYFAFKGSDGNHRVVNTDGTILHEFASEGIRDRSEEDFTWTPDGNSILYGSYDNGIYRYDLSDKTKHQLVNTIGYTYDHNPVMSPDLETIIFVHHEYENDYSIYQINADGSNKELITENVSDAYDEQLNLTWLDNDNFVWKAKSGIKWKLYHCDINTKEVTEINLGNAMFNEIKLSPNKEILTIYDDSKNLYNSNDFAFIKRSDILAGTIDKVFDNIGENYEWDSNNNYFTVSLGSWQYTPEHAYWREDLSIYDKDKNKYKLLKKEDFPEEGYSNIQDIAWSSKTLQ